MVFSRSLTRRWRRSGVAAGVAVAVLSTLTVGVPSYAGPERVAVKVQTSIGPAPAFPAPIGRKGGISNPVASCSDGSEPSTEWVLKNVKTGWTRTYEWEGTLPGMYNPRVPVGTYRSDVTATCRGHVKTRTQRVRIVEKTLEDTVSKAEWRKVHRGMTRAQVTRALGTGGRDPFRYAGELSVTYDMMQFWRWSIIVYRNGRVTEKYWNVGHD